MDAKANTEDTKAAPPPSGPPKDPSFLNLGPSSKTNNKEDSLSEPPPPYSPDNQLPGVEENALPAPAVYNR